MPWTLWCLQLGVLPFADISSTKLAQPMAVFVGYIQSTSCSQTYSCYVFCVLYTVGFLFHRGHPHVQSPGGIVPRCTANAGWCVGQPPRVGEHSSSSGCRHSPTSNMMLQQVCASVHDFPQQYRLCLESCLGCLSSKLSS